MKTETGKQLKIRMEKKKALEAEAPILLYYLKDYHGWGMDLFIEEKCARCLKAIEKAQSKNFTNI